MVSLVSLALDQELGLNCLTLSDTVQPCLLSKAIPKQPFLIFLIAVDILSHISPFFCHHDLFFLFIILTLLCSEQEEKKKEREREENGRNEER